MSEKDKKNLIITGVLIFVLIFMIFNAVKRVKKAKGTTAKSATREKKSLPKGAVVKVSKAGPPAKNLFSKLDKESEGVNLKRDPFSMRTIAATKETSSHGIRLSGILWDEDSPRAVINEEILKVGDKISGSTVTSIEKDRVVLSDAKGSFDLKIGD